MNVKKLTLKSPDFPPSLKNIPSPPKQLYVLGELGTLIDKPKITIVGSRKVSPYGRQVTSNLGRELASKGIVVVSGLALGVDALAHQAALEANGKTIAVLPCGLDKIYPTSHFHLAKSILEKGGALISEYSEGTPPLRQHFIARNRLVSGLGDGVLITEAAEKSGTLHTANFALEQGKTVMAVPGNITNPLSKGTNNLIKTGAQAVTEASDVLLALGLNETTKDKPTVMGDNKEESIILELLASGISDGAELLNKSKLAAPAFNQTLTMLEISDKIRPLGAGHWSLK